MKNSRRFLALMLAFLLAFGNLSTVAMAAEGEGAGIQQTEPVSAEAPAPEAPPADAGTEAVPTEPVLEQAPAEPAQNAQPAEETQPSETPAEVPAEASSPEEAPASGAADAEMNEYSSAEAAPETEQPAAEPGVGGFKLPGMEVPEAPETEIVAPEPQADPSTNANNGIMPIATNWSVDMKLEKLTEGTEFEVGDKVTYRLTAKNTRLIFSIDDLDLTISGVTGIQTGKVEVPRGSSYTTNTTSPDGWHVKDIPVNGTVTIEFSYTITEADVAKGETLTVTAKSETGRHETASESQDVHITLKHTALKVEVTGEKKTVAYNGTTQTADQYTVTVTNKNTSAAIDSSAVSVTVDDGYKASGTDADTYPMDLQGKVKVSVNNDKVYTLDQTDVTVTNGKLTIEQRPITVKVKPAADVYVGDESPVSVVLDGQPENLVKDHVLTLSDATGTVVTTAAGSQAITNVTGAVKIMAGEQDVTKNYKVTYVGTAEVKAKYTITVTVTNGTADPKGPITVPSGKNQTIKFTPNKYYTLGTVTVDGESDTLAADGSYTFTNVIGDHRIEVDYVQDTYTVTLHNGKTVTPKEVTAGGFFTPETPALRDDAVFSGWAKEVGGDVVYTPGQSFTVEGDMDLYAVWTAKKAQTYTCYVTISGIPEETAMDCFAFSGTSISFDLYEKKAGTDEYVLKERKTLAFSELDHFSPWPTYFRLNMTFDGYKEDAYQVRNITFSNEEVVGDPSKGEYKLGPVIATPSDRDIKSTVQEIHSLSYEAYPTYGITINLKVWTDENTSTPVIKSFQYGTRYHDGEKYDVSDVIPESVEYEGHNYIPVYDGHAVSGTIHNNDVTINKTYARDDNRDDVPDVCQTIITYKVVNGAWDDGYTKDKEIEYRFYEQNTRGEWVRKKSLVSKPKNGLWLPIDVPAVGAHPNDGYAPGSWDREPPTELKWLFSGDAGKFDMVFTYTYEKAYTVTYTDGVDDVQVFPDQVYVVKKDATTPAFEGEPKREGYEFAGWKPAVADTVTEDVTYVAQWKAYTSLTATIHNHFSNKQDEALKQHLWYTITDAAGKVVVARTEVPQKTAYPWGMVGATADYGDMDSYYGDGVVVTVPIQLEKALPAGDYTITYVLTGWEKGLSTTSGTFMFLDEKTLVHSFTVTEDGGEAAIDAGTVETWEYWYELKFDGNGGAPVPATMYAPCNTFDDVDTGYVDNKNNKFVIPETVPEKAGYVFLGWTETKPADYGKNGENGLSLMAAAKPKVKYYQPGEIYLFVRTTSITGASKTLYANWEKACKVTYTDGVDDEEVFADQTYWVKKNTNAPAFDGTPTREHYDFIGWATKPGGEVKYTPDAAIKVTGDLTLYAVWQVKTYNQPFTAYVDGLYKSEVMSDAFQMSCTLKFGDGTEIKLDKAKDATFGWLGSPNVVGDTWTDVTISWTVELPETVKGETITVADLVEAYDGYQIRDNYNGKADRSTMYKGSESGVGVMSVDVMMMTYYHTANGGAVKRSGSAVTPPYAVETNMPHKNPTGATAEAAPGYVFKGWYTCDADGTVTSEEPVATNEVLTAADMAHVNDTTVKSNQHFVPVFEKAEMKVEGVNKEYAYDTFYPEVTFTGDLKADALGLTVQYREKEGDWTDTPIGIMHVADSRTIYVRAVDAEGNEVFEEQPVTLSVYPHKVTVKTSDVEYQYYGGTIGGSVSHARDAVEVFYEAKGSNGYGSFIKGTCDAVINVGTYTDHYTFVLDWGHPNLNGQAPIYEADYDVTYEYGDLVVTPIKIYLKAEQKSVPYTGAEQTLPVTVSNIDCPLYGDHGSNSQGYSSRIAYSDTLTADFHGTEPGVYDELKWKIVNKDTGEDMSGNYLVRYEGGLTIDPVITVTVENGTAEPGESPIQVAYGEDRTITFTADQYYELESVTVDGEPAELADDGSYTFSDVIANHSIEVVYKQMIRSVTVEYYYNGVKGYAPADKPTKLEGQVGTTVVLTPDETLKLTYGRGTSYAESYYELDRDAGDTYEAVVQENGSAVIRVYYKNIMVTGTGRLNIIGLPLELLPKDAKLYFTVKWKEVKPTKTGGTTSSSKSESVTYTFGQLLEMDCLEYDDNGYHFNVPITVAKGGYVAKSPSASGYKAVHGYKVVMTMGPSSDSNKINEDGYSVGMLYNIQYADKGEHTVTIHYLDKLTGEKLQPDFVSEPPIHGDKEYDFSDEVPETIEKDGVVYHLFVADLGGSSNLTKAAGTMDDKDIEVTAYYSPDKNGDGTPDAAQVFLTFHVVNGAWNDVTRDDVTKTVNVYSFDESKGK